VTTQQAKQILLAYRPWTNDAMDPEVAGALAMCRHDAELSSWLEQSNNSQFAVRAAFTAITPPEGLRQQIVAEIQARLRPVPWWRKPAIAAAAAVALLILAVGVLWTNYPRTADLDRSLTAYRNRMVRTVVRDYASAMELETQDVSQIRDYLSRHAAHSDYALPKSLEQTPVVGCGKLSWLGKPVAMVCFRTGKPLAAGVKSDLFLFVIDGKDVVIPPQTAFPVFARSGPLATATWNAGGKIYLLAGADASDLRQRL